ncbi:YqaE/Pmp3 family membrane protein [Pseudidiomarina aestuarii]|uniref:YqaE/Pmp3 family membrane protein n=1 Tax=Pseudidiomarina aestuarii TaxID=624146 RepID=A0A6N4DHZ9_9GAMM|nr:YqaE/Pmp3 family membrane protein [Pseudidiomarina aestuarii]
MRYLLAIFLPPLAILTTGRIFHAILSTVLCAVVITLTLVSMFGLAWLWLVCIMHAAFVIDGYHKRSKQVGGDA